MPQPMHTEISLRSYLIWEREGRPAGRDWEHWFRAERELVEERRAIGEPIAGATRAAKPKRKPTTRTRKH